MEKYPVRGFSELIDLPCVELKAPSTGNTACQAAQPRVCEGYSPNIMR